jgi:DNA-binding NarL/FixJ family response regulator
VILTGIDLSPGQTAGRLRIDSPTTSRTEQKFAVAIVDDQPVTRTGMETVVSDDPGMRVVASVAFIDELADEERYDVVFLALPAHGGGSSLDMIGHVAKIAPSVVTSTWERAPTPLAAIRSGARGCVTRHSDQTTVTEALRVAARGGLYLCAQVILRFSTELSRQQLEEVSCLAPREIETLRWIALGFTQSQIATRMGLSQATVNTYAKRIRSKLNAGNKAELTRLAIELGYLGDRHRQDPAA